MDLSSARCGWSRARLALRLTSSLLLATSSACTGTIGPDDPVPADVSSARSSGSQGVPTGASAAPSAAAPPPGSAGTGGPLAPPVGPAAPSGPARCAPAPTRLWRLSDTQYVSAISDLFPGTNPPRISTPGNSDRAFVNYADRFPVGGGLVASLQDAAAIVAFKAAGQARQLARCTTGQEARACAKQFVDRMVSRAFRRPLEGAEHSALMALYDLGAQADFNEGIQLVVEAVLQSPSFLYRTELGVGAGKAGDPLPLTGYEVASLLSFFFLDSIPDELLWQAAGDGSLLAASGIQTQVTRLMGLSRVQANLSGALMRWFGFDHVLTVNVDAGVLPEFQSLRAALHDEPLSFLDKVMWKGGTISDLFLLRKRVVADPVARLYGLGKGSGSDRVEVTVPPERAGLLTMSGLFVTLPNANRVVHRGKFVRTQLLCNPIPSPPANINTAPPQSKGLSDRQFAELRASTGACAACHSFIDPIGLAFERYDSVGRYRSTVDASSVLAHTDVDGPFNDFVELNERLAGSQQVASCVVQQIATYAVGRLLGEGDSCAREQMVNRVRTAGGKMSEVLAAIATSELFRMRSKGE